MDSSLQQHWMQRARVLTQALIISGTLNIGLVSTFVYFILKEKQAVVSLEMAASPSKREFTNEEILRSLSHANFQDLLAMLESEDFVEEGYTKRDLALACLTAFHHFPIAKVLGEGLLQKRVIGFRGGEGGENIEMLAFPGLKDEHFQAVLHFARTEKWPLTTKGLFFEVQNAKEPYDPSLLEAFYTTSEFHSLQLLLQKAVPALEKAALVALLKEGTWEKFKGLCDKLRQSQSYDVETAREFLLSYALEFQSKRAAHCLFEHQKDYIMKRLNDEQLGLFLDLNADKKEGLEALAKDLLLSPRSDFIRQKAASILYGLAQELVPQPYDHMAAIQRFFPQEPIRQVLPLTKKEPEAAPISTAILHKVQAGDSLWKIARKYGTTVEAIAKLNQLESDRLRLGKELKIPEKAR
jgi:hypothetical protein